MRSPLAATVLGFAGALLCGAALAAWRRRQAPASELFVVVAAIAGGGALTVAGLLALDLHHALVLTTVMLVALVLPLPWLLFSFEYTGRNELVSAGVALAVATPSVVGTAATAVIFGSQLVPWFRLPSREAASGLTAVTITFLSATQWLTLLYVGGLMLVGSGVLLWTFHRYAHLDSSAGMLLGVFGVVPWLSLLIGLQVDGVATFALSRTVSVGFLAGGVAAASLVGLTDLFGTVPAAGNVGPTTVVEELGDVVVVTDGEGTTVELNAAAQRQLEVTTADVVGASIEEILDAGLAELRTTGTVELRSETGRTVFEPTVSELTDQHDRLLGYAVVLRDVTDRISRRQRLEVFNRVLRHNLGNDMTVILSHARRLQKGVDDPQLAESAAAVIRAGENLTQLSETARNVEQIMDGAGSTDRTVRLASLVDRALATATPEHRHATHERDVPADVVVEGTPELLELALTNLVENAVAHNDSERPRVEVSATYRPERSYPLCVSVADNGPGIPDNERRVVEKGDETPLRHGSGLGLWAVRWAITGLGGDLEFDEREPRGTVVSLYLPGARREETPPEQQPASQLK
jgi:signal transduction histidine kinase